MKILFQEICSSKFDWDETLTDEIKVELVFARGFVVMTSRFFAVHALFTRYHFALYLQDFPRHQ